MSLDFSKAIAESCLITPGASANLQDREDISRELFPKRADAMGSLKADRRVIADLQDKLFAEKSQGLLVVLQGMDTSGKSGTLKSVFARTSPEGMNVKAFKAPNDEERAHDYLWRVHQAAPKKGFITIFDRSHYEDILVVKVRKFASEEAIEQRYQQINDFERLLAENNVRILKFMLNISYEEQGERLHDRLVRPEKRWKFNPRDLEDRQLWDSFQDAYSLAVERCSTEHAPWYVIPSNSRSRRNAMIASIVRRNLEDMNPSWPDPGWKIDDYDFS